MNIPLPPALSQVLLYGHLDIETATKKIISSKIVPRPGEDHLTVSLVFHLIGETPTFCPVVFWSRSGGWCDVSAPPGTFMTLVPPGTPMVHPMTLVPLPGSETDPGRAIAEMVDRTVVAYRIFRHPVSSRAVADNIDAISAFVNSHVVDPAVLLEAIGVMES